MSERTERHPAEPGDDLAGEGHESMPNQHGMSERTERHPAEPGDDLAGEGHEGRRKVSTA